LVQLRNKSIRHVPGICRRLSKGRYTSRIFFSSRKTGQSQIVNAAN
jgi:hypothetical protein